MNSAFLRLFKRFVAASITVCLSLSLMLFTNVEAVKAGRTSMTGDFAKDTVYVAQSLKDTIAIPDEEEGRSEAQKESVKLITDYISRYRNRPQVNQTVSYTTMQTALNSMAGHVKTFSNRPLPEQLKTRLSKELSKAESMVSDET